MTTIFLCGKRSDNAVSDVLAGALRQYGMVQYFNGDVLKRYSEKTEPEFCIYDCEELPKLELPSGILLFKNSFLPTKKPEIPMGFLTVFGSHNSRAASALKGTGLIAVACGTSAKDTLSVASLTDSSACVSLQRNVRTVTGEVLEPRDISIELCRQLGPYSLLATCAVFLLAGVPSDDGYRF
jgi:hypothetical protein